MAENTQNKQREIVAMFDSIAQSYDLANRVLSLGIDLKWRKEACQKALALCDKNALDILDIACGTGDMILQWQKIAHDFMDSQDSSDSRKSNESQGRIAQDSRDSRKIASICGIDPSFEMLKIALKKLGDSATLLQGEARDLNTLKNIKTLESCAIKSDSMDILSIAYGLRNVVEIDLALSEFHRVLRKNGVLVILEFSKKDNENILDKLARFYTKRILPYLGGFIAQNYKAYKYLPDSVEHFLSLEEIADKLQNLGFEIVLKKRYACNLCSLIIAKKCTNR